MGRFWRLALLAALMVTATAAFAASAAANTFYVNTRGGDADNHHCEHEGANACGSIVEAVEEADQVAGASTIIVQSEGPGEGAVFRETEPLELASSSDNGLTITGEEPHIKVVGPTSKATLSLGAAAGTVTVSNLTLEGASGTVATITDRGANLELENVVVEADLGSAANGIEAEKGGSLTMEGGGVEMENNLGYDILARETPVTLNNAKLLNAQEGPDEAGGVYSTKTGLTIENTKIATGASANTNGHGIHTIEDGSVTLQNDTVQQSDSKADGVLLESSPTTVDGLTIEMDGGSSSDNPGIYFDGLAPSNSSVENLTVDGDWGGPAVLARSGALTIADSHLTANQTAQADALLYVGVVAGGSLLVERSVLKSNPGSTSGVLTAVDGNVTLDSSEVLGSTEAIRYLNGEGRTGTLTVAASTVDAGAPGIAGDAANDLAVKAYGVEGSGTVTNVNVEGSIMLEPSAAVSEEGGQASIACSYSSVPSQSVAANGGEGPVSCASGSSGNTNVVGELPSLFSEPFSSYALSPSSAAIDSVPVSAIVLPFGLTPSSTDLDGNPRSEGVGCVQLQDRGALELPGHGRVCPGVPPAVISATQTVAKPLAGILTGLTLSPSAFLAAPFGATVSAVVASKKKYGTKISYRDSQVAVTTFTVLRESSGRKRGKSCQKPSPRNVHGKRCTLLVKVASFTHADMAGANSLRFSGRIRGRKLAAGTYVLQAVAHDAAGNGPTVSKAFKIEVR
jgi:Right handed beta helix region